MGFRFLTTFATLAFCLIGCTSKTEKDFIRGCTADGYLDNKKQCSCVYTELENRYGEKSLELMGKTNYIPDDFPEQMVQSMATCGLDTQ